MTRRALILSLTILSIVPSCSYHRDSPEEVLIKFYEALKEGDCEKLKSLSSDQGVEMMTDWLESGCEPLNIAIDSVYCNTSDGIAYCSCYETRENGTMRFDYVLELIDDEWKATPREKDILLPEDDPWDRSTQN